MRTKNVYVGNQRVVSVLNPDEQTRYEYYYHTDYLGSTTYLTDRDGKLKEHIEYTPWGEGWIEQEQGFPTDYLPYKFTGKELDSTGLYYFGARYYDPRISMWLSADPALGRYLDSAGEASQNNDKNSVFDSKNLAMYSYGHQNPLVFIDPDGLSTIYIEIYRDTATDNSISGTLTLNYKSYGVTLEKPYNNNINEKSSIPAGDYFGKFYSSDKFPDTIEIQVPGRSEILFHAGNIPEDSTGCILVGKYRNENKQDFIFKSQEAFNEFKKTINDIKRIDKNQGEQTDIIIKVIDATKKQAEGE